MMSPDEGPFEIRAPDGGWGWVVCISCFMCHVLTDGMFYSFGVVFVELLDYFKESKGATAIIASLAPAVCFLIGPIVAVLVNRFGCRAVTIAGALVASFSQMISIFAPSIEFLYVTLGVMTGVGYGLIYLPSIVALSQYFEKRRAFATGLGVSGAGIGTFIFSPFTSVLIHIYTWQGAILIHSALLLNCVACGLVYRPVQTEMVKVYLPEEDQLLQVCPETGVIHNNVNKETRDNTGTPKVEHKQLTDVKKMNEKKATGLAQRIPDRKDKVGLDESIELARGTNMFGDKVDKERKKTHTFTVTIKGTASYMDKVVEERHEPITIDEAKAKAGTEPVKAWDGTHINEVNVVLRKVRPSSPDGGDIMETESLLAASGNEREPTGQPENKNTSAPPIGDIMKADDYYNTELGAKPKHDIKILPKHDIILEHGDVNSLKGASPVPDSPALSEIVGNPSACKTDDASMGLTSDVKLIPETKKSTYRSFDWTIFSNVPFIMFCLSSFFCSLGYYVPYIYLPDTAREAGIDEFNASWLLSSVGITNTIGRVLFGFLSDRAWINRLMLYNTALVLLGFSTSLAPLLKTFSALLMYTVVFGIFSGVTISLTSVILADIVGIDRLTDAMGVNNFFAGVAAFAGPPLAGWLYDVSGNYIVSYVCSGVAIALSGAILYTVPLFDKPKKL